MGPRIGNALVSYTRYLGKTVWPSGLAPYYPHPHDTPLVVAATAGLLLAALSWLLIWKGRRKP